MKIPILTTLMAVSLGAAAYAVPTIPTTTGSLTQTTMGTGYGLEASGAIYEPSAYTEEPSNNPHATTVTTTTTTTVGSSGNEPASVAPSSGSPGYPRPNAP